MIKCLGPVGVKDSPCIQRRTDDKTSSLFDNHPSSFAVYPKIIKPRNQYTQGSTLVKRAPNTLEE